MYTNSTSLNKVREEMKTITENDIKGMIELVLEAEKERITANKFRYICKSQSCFP